MTKIDDVYTALDVGKYVVAVCKQVGVRVVWDDPKSTPRTNGKVMYLPKINAYASHKNNVNLKQFVKHETSHIQYSDFSLLQKYKPTGLLMLLDNLLEDHRIDYLNDTEYDGDRKNTEQFMSYYAADLEKIVAVNDEWQDVISPLMAWDADVREDVWTMPYKLFHSYMSEEGKRIYAELHAGDYADVLRSIRTIENPTIGGQKVYDLAVRILTEIFKQDAKDYTDSKEKTSASGADGEGEGGEKSAEVDGSADAPSKEEGKSKSERKKLLVVDVKGKKVLPYTIHEGVTGEGINAYNYKTGSGVTYCPADADLKEWDFTTSTGKNIEVFTDGRGARAYVSSIKNAMENSESLAHQVRTKLQILSRDRYEYGKKKGALHNSALYRATIKDAKGFNERIFKQKIVNNTLDVAVQVLVDASGSMSGSKFTNASAAAVLLNDVLSNTLRIPVEILAFSECSGANTMFTMKSFDKSVLCDTLIHNFSTVGRYLADNVDGESIAYGYGRIKKRKEKRKLMIVLSDGSPCGGHSRGDIQQYTQDVIRSIESSPIELLGVGIMYDAVKHYYKRWATIDSASDIQSGLLSIISNNIIREGV
jgi:Mg-chelatase subunit ChlD